MELAKKITPSRFEQLLGFKVEALGDILGAYYFTNRGDETHAQIYKNSLNRFHKDDIETMEESDFVNNIMNLMADTDMMAEDLGRISTYGEVIRDNPKVVLIDYDLTQSVYKTHYSREI